MACPLVLTVDSLVGDEPLERRHRFERDVEQQPRLGFAVPRDKRLDIELEAREHLPRISRAGAESDVLALEDDDRRAGFRQLARGRQASVARADDDDVRLRLQFRALGAVV